MTHELSSCLPDIDTIFTDGGLNLPQCPDALQSFTWFEKLPNEIKDKVFKEALSSPEILTVKAIVGDWSKCYCQRCKENNTGAMKLGFVSSPGTFDLSKVSKHCRALAKQFLPSTLPTFGPLKHEIRYDPTKTSIYIENFLELLNQGWNHTRFEFDESWLCKLGHRGEGVKSMALDACWFVDSTKGSDYYWQEKVWIELFSNLFPDLEEIIVLFDDNYKQFGDYVECDCDFDQHPIDKCTWCMLYHFDEDSEDEDSGNGESEDENSENEDVEIGHGEDGDIEDGGGHTDDRDGASGERGAEDDTEDAGKVGSLPLSNELEEKLALEKEAYLALSPSQLFDEETSGTSDLENNSDTSVAPDKVPLRIFKKPLMEHSRNWFNDQTTIINDHFDNISDEMVRQGHWGPRGRAIPKLRFHEESVKNGLKLFRLPHKDKADRFDFETFLGGFHESVG